MAYSKETVVNVVLIDSFIYSIYLLVGIDRSDKYLFLLSFFLLTSSRDQNLGIAPSEVS